MELIVGATGHLGGVIATRLLERGNQVRALVREGSDSSDLEAAGADLIQGDLKDRESIATACDGVRGITATATAALRGGADTIDAVDRAGYQSLIEVAQAADVEQFVYVSAHGFAADKGPALSRAKGETEMALRQSGLGYTILRPALFMEAWISMVIGSQLQHGRRVTILGDPDRQYGFIASQNVVDLALAVIGQPSSLGKTIPFSAGAASYRQITDWIGETIGEPIIIETIGPGQSVSGLPPIVNDLWAYAASGGMAPLETSHTAAELDIALISPEGYVRQAFASGY